MRLLAVGDVCGPVGCDEILKKLPKLKKDNNIDVVIVNGENSAVGNGITSETAQLIMNCGADVITGGNHTLRHSDFRALLDESPVFLRPDNLTGCTVGRGYTVIDFGRFSVAVINMLGNVYLDKTPAANPFLAVDGLIERANADKADFIVVDFHAEATSEKIAMGYYLDGRVSAVFGTHTHVQTADETILPGGTGYITDIGMTGPKISVLGIKKDIIINRFCNISTEKFEFAETEGMLSGCIFEFDNTTTKCTDIRRIVI